MTQEQALTILKTGANAFLTGEPGSGKTFVANEYIEWLRDRGIEPAVTASTGIAATHLGGMTIHAWCGIGVLEDLTDYDLDRIASTERVARRVRNARVLVVDEISMLSARTFAMADRVCRAIRMDERPFGGLQAVFVGDFFQLPPVTRMDSRAQAALDGEAAPRSGAAARHAFAFASPAWKDANPLACYLHEQHRQEDGDFATLLGAIRRGAVSDDERALLESRIDESAGLEGHERSTKLFPHNAAVDRLNDAALASLPGKEQRFVMEKHGSQPRAEALAKGCLSPELLVLKDEARVMFTKNDPMQRYANGTLGTVVGFEGASRAPVVELAHGGTVVAEPAEWKMDDEGKTLAKIIQVPLRLAWAITVHKSQGMSLDRALIDLRAAFEYGQGYVALSRVRTLEGLTLLGLNQRALEVHPAIKAQDDEFRAQSAAAGEAFGALPTDELQRMQRDFVRALGGVEPVRGTDTEAGRSERKAARARAKSAPKIPTIDATLALFNAGESLDAIAAARGVKAETIVDHLEQLKELGRVSTAELQRLGEGDEQVARIQAAFKKLKSRALKPLHAHFKGDASYASIRLARLLLPD